MPASIFSETELARLASFPEEIPGDDLIRVIHADGCRVRNWSDYNRALIARGRLTFWFDQDAVAAWRNADPPKGPGAPKVYSDTAIQCALILKSVFQLSLRSTQGFVSSLLELLRLDLPVPDYSTWRRS